MTDRIITVFVETTTTRRASFSVAELANLTAETEEDIRANIDQDTLRAWATDYLSDVPNLLAAMDAAPDAGQSTSAPFASAYLRHPQPKS